MKLIREHINEKFVEESDPIKDMGVGLIHKINKWLEYFIKLRSMRSYVYRGMFTINDDLTIDVDGDLDISYDYMKNLPSYIKLNKVTGEFHCFFRHYSTFKINGPKIVEGNYTIYYTGPHKPINEETLRKYCDVKGDVYFYIA